MGLLLLYAIVAPVAWALCRMSAGQDAEEAQRALVALVAEQAAAQAPSASHGV